MRSYGAAPMTEGPSHVLPRSEDAKTRSSSRRSASWSGPTVSRKVSAARTAKPHIRPEPVGAIGLLSQVRPPSPERNSRSWLKWLVGAAQPGVEPDGGPDVAVARDAHARLAASCQAGVVEDDALRREPVDDLAVDRHRLPNRGPWLTSAGWRLPLLYQERLASTHVTRSGAVERVDWEARNCPKNRN